MVMVVVVEEEVVAVVVVEVGGEVVGTSVAVGVGAVVRVAAGVEEVGVGGVGVRCHVCQDATGVRW